MAICHTKDTYEIFKHRCVPNTIVISISSIVCTAFLECLECHGVVYLIKELTQYCYLKHHKLQHQPALPKLNEY